MPRVEELSDRRELRRCIRDPVALSTLPAIWTGYGPKEIADSVATALVSMLEADFVYIALPMNGEEPTLEVAHVGAKHSNGATNAIGRAIAPESFRGAGITTLIPNPVGEGSARVVTAPLGSDGDALVVVGSAHSDFPTETRCLCLALRPMLRPFPCNVGRARPINAALSLWSSARPTCGVRRFGGATSIRESRRAQPCRAFERD